MSEHKTPDPMWTAEKLHAVIEKIYSEYAPLCKTELGLMFARDIATLMALQFQLTEAFGVPVTLTSRRQNLPKMSSTNTGFRSAH